MRDLRPGDCNFLKQWLSTKAAAGIWWAEARDASVFPTVDRTTPSSQQRTVQPQMSVMLWLRNVS